MGTPDAARSLLSWTRETTTTAPCLPLPVRVQKSETSRHARDSPSPCPLCLRCDSIRPDLGDRLRDRQPSGGRFGSLCSPLASFLAGRLGVDVAGRSLRGTIYPSPFARSYARRMMLRCVPGAQRRAFLQKAAAKSNSGVRRESPLLDDEPESASGARQKQGPPGRRRDGTGPTYRPLPMLLRCDLLRGCLRRHSQVLLEERHQLRQRVSDRFLLVI